ncbi:MAG: DUF4118 domain-containing protein, partial [Ruthenibacterium sp.]
MSVIRPTYPCNYSSTRTHTCQIFLPPAALPLLFVLGVLATALTTSLVPATLAAVLGFIAHNLLFTA